MTKPTEGDLQAALLVAHAKDERGALVRLYTTAADQAESDGDIDRAAFFLTHAWIFALEQDDPAAAQLERRLAAWNRIA